MASKCLMLETKDKKRFFTFIKNSPQLREYCRTFGAKMMVVKADLERKQVLDLPKLVPALCDKGYENKNIKFVVVKTLS